MKIFTGTGHPDLAERIVAYLGKQLTDVDVKKFPDGETFVKINENIRGHDVFIVQPTCPPSNDNLMELLIMVDAARRASANRITAVIPFFGYARQDRKDQPRVPITAKLVANLLTAAGVDRVLTMDLHAGQIQGFFDIPVDHLYAKPVILKYVRKIIGDQPLAVISPDVGGLKMSYSYAQDLNSSMGIVAKHRESSTVVKAMDLIGNVEDCNVLLVDDMTETGGTLKAAAELLKSRGACDIYACVSHAILNDAAREKIKESEIKELITTNSVPMANGEGITTLSIAGLLGKAILSIHNSESVTSLFEENMVEGCETI